MRFHLPMPEDLIGRIGISPGVKEVDCDVVHSKSVS